MTKPKAVSKAASVDASALNEETRVPGKPHDSVALVIPTEEKEKETLSARVIPGSADENADVRLSGLADLTEAK